MANVAQGLTANVAQATVVAKKSSIWRGIKLALIGLLSLSLAIISLGAIIYYRWTHQSLPQRTGEIEVATLKQEVVIKRDQWGVPYIKAATLDDLFFAQGYVTAQDRLWQMDFLRRAAKGELAEILGAGNDNSLLELDKLQRSIGLWRAAKDTLSQLNPRTQAALAAYSRGVNDYVAAHRDRLPLEFKLLQYEPTPWQAADSIVVEKLLALSLTSSWQRDLMRTELAQKLDPKVYQILFYEKTPYNAPVVAGDTENNDQAATAQLSRQKSSSSKLVTNVASNPQDLSRTAIPKIDPTLMALAYQQSTRTPVLTTNQAQIGSNNWVISGAHSQTGQPLLANDPHQGLTVPAAWYQIHLQTENEDFKVAGVSAVGLPGVVIGHNQNIAWGATALAADVQDVYFEEFDKNNPSNYRVGNEWKPATIVPEKILVRESLLSQQRRVVTHNVIITRHGPIVAELNNQKIALSWSGGDTHKEIADASREIDGILQINQATNWKEFCATLQNYGTPAINYIYADKQGNIGYYAVGYLPRRKTGSGATIYDGRNDEGEWLEYIPFEELPHLYNPAKGVIATANNKITAEDYPERLSNDWAPPYRAFRCYELLKNSDGKFDLGFIQQMQNDNYSLPYHLFAEVAVKMANSAGNDPIWQDLAQELQNWDGQLTTDTRSGAIAVAFREELTERFLKGWLGELYSKYWWPQTSTIIDRAIVEQPQDWLPAPYKSYQDLVKQSYESAIAKLTTQLGKDRQRWRYGDTNVVVFNHPLGQDSPLSKLFNASPLAAGGSNYSLNTTNSYLHGWGPSMRLAVSLANWDDTTLTVAPGVSGQTADPHYLDQIADWQQARPHKFPFTWSQVEAHTLQKLVLKGKLR
jgi:penicillin G amidase